MLSHLVVTNQVTFLQHKVGVHMTALALSISERFNRVFPHSTGSVGQCGNALKWQKGHVEYVVGNGCKVLLVVLADLDIPRKLSDMKGAFARLQVCIFSRYPAHITSLNWPRVSVPKPKV